MILLSPVEFPGYRSIVKSVSAKSVLSTFTFKNVISCAARLDSSVDEHFFLLALGVVRHASSHCGLQQCFLVVLHLSEPLYFRMEAASPGVLAYEQ